MDSVVFNRQAIDQDEGDGHLFFESLVDLMLEGPGLSQSEKQAVRHDDADLSGAQLLMILRLFVAREIGAHLLSR